MAKVIEFTKHKPKTNLSIDKRSSFDLDERFNRAKIQECASKPRRLIQKSSNI